MLLGLESGAARVNDGFSAFVLLLLSSLVRVIGKSA